jgi:hypothetical protein
MSDSLMSDVLGLVLTALVMGGILAFTITRMRLRRPEFSIGLPIVVGVGLRLIAIAGINSTGVQDQLRGGDESTFLAYAHAIANTPWGRGFLPHKSYQLQTDVFAAQIKLFNLSPTALRVTQVGISMLGILLIVAAVYDLAGPRAARITAWVGALEPANIFFNSSLSKEPIMLLATGLVVLGSTKIWRRLDPVGALLCALGGVIAVYTRSYAGWFLVSASVVVLLHAAIRNLNRPIVAMPVIYAVAGIIALVTPTLLSVTSNKSLKQLQQAQNFTTGQQANTSAGGANSDNLALEQVNFSTRGEVIKNLPQRMFDIIFRPYPWQLSNTSQQLGAVGTVIAVVGFFALLGFAWRARGDVLTLTAPILYPLIFLLIAYSLSAGNAGTGFRYRSHLVLLGGAMLVILREHVLEMRVRARERTAAEESDGKDKVLSSVPLGGATI